MIDRRAFLAIATAALAAPLTAEAQRTGKVDRVGFLSYLGCGTSLAPNDPFLQGLRESGYFEGRNLVIECRDAPGRFDRLPDLAVELVRLNPDVLVTEGTPQSLAGKRATTTIPIVMVGVGDPVGSGLVASLARPGGNITAAAMFPAVDVVVKGLEMLKEIAPGLSRIAVMWDPTNLALISIDKQLTAASRRLRIELHRISVRAAEDVQDAFAAGLDRRAQALLVHPLPLAPPDMQRIWNFALTNGLPTVTFWEPYAKQGVLLSYGPLVAEMRRHAAGLVDQVLKGAKPSDLPVAQPRKFALVINLKTAKTLGLTLPPSLLLRADQVIE